MTERRRLGPLLAGLRRDQGGAAAVEFAFVAMVLIALCIGVVQLGIAIEARNELAQAADRGIRFIVLDPDASDTVIEAKIEALLGDYESSSLVVDVGEQTIDSTDYRTVTIDYDMQLAIPGLYVDLVTLNAFRQVPKAS